MKTFLRKTAGILLIWDKSNVSAGFTTRHFPLLLKKTDDLLELSNQTRLTDAFERAGAIHGSSLRAAFLQQTHGSRVAVIADAVTAGAIHELPLHKHGTFRYFAGTDAAITNIKGLTLLVLSADCLSIFYSAGPWVGLAHAGWRGTEKGIAKKTLELICARSGCGPGEVKIAFGPRIGFENYEVGEEFQRYFPVGATRRVAPTLRRKNGKLFFDLTGENRRQLLETGVKQEHIFDPGICTVAENAHFYSFRKEKDKAGRMISFICLSSPRMRGSA